MFVLAFAIIFFLFSKNLDFSNTFLNRWAGIGKGSLIILTALPLDSSEVKAELNFGAFSVNLFTTLDLNKLMYLSVESKSHPDL